MFRISANYDDPWHPLQGDVRTVASVAELLAIALAAFEDILPDALLEMMPGDRCEAYGFGVEYTVERI